MRGVSGEGVFYLSFRMRSKLKQANFHRRDTRYYCTILDYTFKIDF